MQLNAWGGRLEPPIARFIEQQKPDIICLQEVISFQRGQTGLFIPLESIQSQANLPFISFAPVFSFPYMKGMARFGNAVLSRFPIQKSEVIFTYLEHKDDFMFGEDDNNIRNFIHAVIEINGVACNVLTHHGYWIHEHKNGNSETFRQTKLLADYIKNLEGPVILSGDFNLVPGSGSLESLNNQLTNLSVKHKLKTTRTLLTVKTEVCDYIFVNDSVKVKSFRALDDVISDHKPLLLDFEL